MDFNATIDLIIKDLEEAREIIDDLKKYPGVPFLQVELAKSKCKSAAEIIALLKSIKESQPGAINEPVKPVTERKVMNEKAEQSFLPDEKTASETRKEVVEIKKVETIKEETEVIFTTANEKKIESLWKEVPIQDKEEPIEIKTQETKEKPKTITEKKTTIIADRFRHEEDDGTELLNVKRLTNLTDAIGINDSFLFIREIFKGDKATYTEAIMKLDKAESIKDAKAVIMSYTGSNIENEAIDQLLHLVKRKLLMHE
jgi:hypothetical protein